MTDLWLDLETFCDVPITNGTHIYAESVEITLFAWAIDDGPVGVVDLANGEQLPAPLVEALRDDTVEVWAHNTGFDRTVLRHVMPDLCPPLHRWRDTLVQALSHSMPGGLGPLSDILKLGDEAKDKKGRDLVLLFCKPRPKGAAIRRATRDTHPEQWEEFKAYAGKDIEAMRAARKKMPTWNYQGSELALWHLDQKINDRGVCIDLELAACAVDAAAKAQKLLAARTFELTNEEVKSATQRNALLKHLLAEYGVDLPDLQKSTLERRIEDESLPWALRELLAIRLQASTTSTSKYKTLLKATSSDGRLRGTLQFNGASRTGRWAGRLFQPQNLPRPTLSQHIIDMCIDALKADCVDLVFDNVMVFLSSAIRGAIVAPRGKKLVVSDLSNIEGRVAAWLAGESWKLEAFRAFDRGEGHDLYKLAYAKAFGIRPEDVTKDQRQVGKVLELFMQYEGGVGAFLIGAASYNIDLDDMAEKAYPSIPQGILNEARSALAYAKLKKRSTFGLAEKTWIVCDSLKRMWREAHPAIASYWGDLADTVRWCILHPGVTRDCRLLKVRRDGSWLRIRLPSGRYLCYPSPQVDSEKVTYMGVHQYTRKWSRLSTYGGKVFENCITGDTDVLTVEGWRRLDSVGTLPVWDGHEWVKHDGCIYKGKQLVLTAYGVQMTPDHLALTKRGWTSASSCAGLDRAEVRLPNGYPLHRLRERAKVHVGSEVCLREVKGHAGFGISQAAEARDFGVVRVPTLGKYCGAEHHPRHEWASGVQSMAQHARPLPSAFAQGLSQLRRAGNRGVRALARVLRGFLGGHGADVQNREQLGAGAERSRILADQLPLGHEAQTSKQPPLECAARDTAGQDHFIAGSAALRNRSQHAGLPDKARLACEQGARDVYDLINCGPRHQFVVRGADGRALIVHNCCQAVARDVMAHNMPLIEEFRP